MYYMLSGERTVLPSERSRSTGWCLSTIDFAKSSQSSAHIVPMLFREDAQDCVVYENPNPRSLSETHLP